MTAQRKDAKPTSRDAERQVNGFIDKFDSKHRTLIRAVRKALHAQFPTAHELAYDNYNFFVLGYGPTPRPSDCIISLTAGASGVGLCFLHGASLPDPHSILLGEGKQTRFVRIGTVNDLTCPEVQEMIAAALAHSKAPMRQEGRVELVVRSVSAKQRPRRKTTR